MLVHHTAKPPQGGSDGHAGNMNSARGASALTGVARVVQTLFGMSGKDAEACGVDEEDRHLYVRLDDAKANLGPPGMATRWFQREGVQIANGDEVGVLVPTAIAGDRRRQRRTSCSTRSSPACWRLVPEPELSLNAAARRLAWGGDQQFARYRETDDKGHQRASKPLRTAILAACRQGVCVVLGDLSCGFTCNTQEPADHAAPVRATRLDRRPRRRGHPSSRRSHDPADPRVDGCPHASTPANPGVWTESVWTRPHGSATH